MRYLHSVSISFMFILILLIPAVSHGLTVTNLNNVGAGSLRDDVTNTPAGGTVDFAVTGVITLLSEIVIEKNLTIQGPGANLLTISGGNTSRIFITDTVTVDNLVISGLRFANGNSMSGGGAIAYGPNAFDPEDSRFEINKCVFENNTSLSGGGAILIFGGGASGLPDLVIIKDSTFRSNASAQGGAISVLPLLTKLEIYNSTFESNSAVCNSGFCVGGAIFSTAPFPLFIIYNNTFESNTVICNGDNCLLAQGGALYLSSSRFQLKSFLT